MLGKKGRLSVLLFATVTIAPLGAWNATGHMTVAYICYQKLSQNPGLKKKVLALLQQHPDYEVWVEGIPKTPAYDDLRGLTAFLRASVWPDEIRNDPRFQNGGDNAVAQPDSTGFPDMYRHQNWHYINLPLVGSFDALKADASDTSYRKAPTALTQIHAFRTAIADPALSGAARGYFLSWLIHLAGDIHQPLHAVARQSDQGGNLVKLDTPEGNLHALWDYALGSETGLGPISVLGEALMRVVADDSSADLDEETWFRESGELAIQFVYRGLAGLPSTDKGLALTPHYRVVATNVAETRVALAGYRLAKVIAAALGN